MTITIGGQGQEPQDPPRRSLRQQLGLDRPGPQPGDTDAVGDLRPQLEQDELRRQRAGGVLGNVSADPVGDLRPQLEADQQARQARGEDFAMASFAEAVKADPDVRAEAQDLARQLGVDPDTAERNRDVMRQYAKVRAQRQRVMEGANPVLARHMGDIEFARIAHDDTENLGAWERLFAQWDAGKIEFEQGSLGERARAGQATQAELQRLAFVRARLQALPSPEGFLQGSARIIGQQAATLPHALTVGAGASLASGGAALLLGQTGPQVATPEEIVTVPSAMVAGFVQGTLGAMAVQAYQMEAGSAYLEMLDQGYDRDIASHAAVGVGMANAALELVGVKLLARGAGITSKSLRELFGKEVQAGVVDALRRPTLGEAGKRLLGGYLEGLGGEVFTEVAQEAVNVTAEEIARRLSQNPEALNSSVTRGEVLGRLVDVATQTAQGMALLALPGPAANFARESRRAAAAEHTAQFWRELGTAADASKVRTRNVGAAERFLADAAKGGAAENTFIDAQAFSQVLQQADNEAQQKGEPTLSDKLEKAMPGITNAVATAAANGGDLVIPTAQIAAKIAGTGKAYEALLPHMRLDPDAMSLADAEQFRLQQKELQDAAEQAVQEQASRSQAFAASLREVEDTLRTQLEATGRFPRKGDARLLAHFYGTMVANQAMREGMLPSEFHARYPLQVFAGAEEAAAALRQTGTEDSGTPAVDADTPVPDNARRDEQPGAAQRAVSEPEAGDAGAVPEPGASGERAPAAQPPRWTTRDDVRGTYSARTDLTELHTRELGAERVTSAAEAGQALAYLGRGAVERFDALLTDADGKPLAIVGSFKGAVGEASVHVSTLVAEAFRVKGAARIWFAHNHPSGSVKLSTPDRAIHARLVETFRGSRIEPAGLFAIGGGAGADRQWVFEPSSALGTDETGAAAQPTATTAVPVLERVISSDGRLGPTMRSTRDAFQFAEQVADGEAGAILLDNQNRPLAFVPVSPTEAKELRKDERMDALFRSISVANAAQVVLVNNGSLSDEGVHNLGRFFHMLDVKTLDVVDTKAGIYGSWSDLGKELDLGGTFKSGSRGSYDPKRLIAFLHEKADGSTFLHELSHHYLAILADLASRPNAPATTAQDMQALLDWFGVKDLATWNAMTLEEQQLHHEKFAYSFEGYLFDGRAPSTALAPVFARVAAWFRRVYRDLRDRINELFRREFGEDLPALTPEVRRVFDRMLASEDQIVHAQQVQGMAAVFESQAEAGVTDPEWAEYLAMQQEATQAAIDEHAVDSLRQMQWLSGARARVLRELQLRRRAVREGVREDVEAELRREPVYRAQRWLQHGELVDVDGTSSGVQPGPHKLATAAVRELLPDVDLRKLGGRYGIVAKEGLDPGTVAKVFGFPDGAALVRALISAEPLDRVVEARTDERMLAEHSDLVDPKKVERSIQEALHNENRTRQIAVEQRMLTKAAQPVRLMVQAAREAARRIIGRQEVWLVSPREHAAAEARAARQVGEALRKGEPAAAIAAQRNRLLQHEAVKAADEALDDVEAAEDTFARFYERDDRVAKGRDIDLVYAGRALAAAFAFGPKLQQGQEQQLVEAALKALREDESTKVVASYVDAWLDRVRAQGGTYRELSVNDLRDLLEVGEIVWDLAGKKKVLEIEGRKVELQTAVDRLGRHVGSLPDRNAPGARAIKGISPSPAARTVLKGWNVLANLKRFTFWARFMDGGEAGPFRDYFLRPMLHAIGVYRQKRDEVIEQLHPRIQALAKAAGHRWDAAIAAPELGGHIFRGKKEVIGAVAQAGSHSGLEKLLVGYEWAPKPELNNDELDTRAWDAFLKRMFDEGVLTADDVEFVRFLWGLYAEQLPASQKTHKEVYGFEFKTIEHRELRTPFGTLEGGYVPAYADRDASDQRLAQLADTIEGDEHAFVYSVSTGRGHTLSRNPFYRKPLALDLAQQMRHMDAHLRFTYLQPAIKSVMRIVRNGEFKSALDSYDREAVNSVILPWLENVALQATSRPSGMPLVDAGATLLRRVTSLAALGFNLGNALIQTTGFANSVSAVKGRYMRAGIATLFTNPLAAVRLAMEKSAWMLDRLSMRAEAMRADISRIGSEPGGLPFLPKDFVRGWQSAKATLGLVAFLPQRILQGAVDVATWHGAYQQAMAESKVDGSLTLEQAESLAVEAADDAVRRTQGGGAAEDLAAYESGTPAMKLLTQFGSYSNVVLNSILAAGPGLGPRARAALWVLLMPAIAEATMRLGLIGVPDDDDGDGRLDELAGMYAGNVLRNVIGLVPGAGPIALSLAESEGSRVIATPAATTLGAAVRGAFQVGDLLTGESDLTGSEMRAFGVMLTVGTGMPIVPLTRAAGYELDVDAGKKPEPSGALDHLRGLLIGR